LKPSQKLPKAGTDSRPFLRWAGSKKQLLPVLLPYWNNEFVRYIEPFAGSARLFFEASPKKGILADINEDLIQTYMEVKHRLPNVVRSLARMKKSRRDFNRIRRLRPKALSKSQRAARFIYLNRYCFNGLYRTNLSGRFNVPYGRDGGKLPTREVLALCSKRLRNTKLRSADFAETLREAKAGDFVYMDPPFHVQNKRVFKEYGERAFDADDLARLRNCMLQLDQEGARFLISYAKCPEAKVLTGGFYVKTVSVKRSIAGFRGARRRSYELLISNFVPADTSIAKTAPRRKTTGRSNENERDNHEHRKSPRNFSR
jgi:DNA adenine methylase